MAARAEDRRRRRHRGWRACDWGAVAVRRMGAGVRARILPSPDWRYGFVARGRNQVSLGLGEVLTGTVTVH